VDFENSKYIYSHLKHIKLFHDDDGDIQYWDIEDHLSLYDWCLTNPDDISTDERYENLMDSIPDMWSELKDIYRMIIDYYRNNKSLNGVR
jgi:hypothetical protein